MTENAPQLPQTIAYLADVGIESVNVLQLLDVNGRSGYLDPLLHFSERLRGVDQAQVHRDDARRRASG